jgi:protein-tyrosine phosphatase
MKRNILALTSLFVLIFVSVVALSPVVSAASCNGVETTVDFHCDDYNTDGASAILMYVISFMAVGVGIAVVIGIIFGGIMYAQSDGEESKAKEGREIIANSIIGLFLFIFLYAGADFLLPGGVFNLNAKPTEVAETTPPPTTGGGGGSPTKSLPKLTSVNNFRDAGGSGYIKKGLLLRSANLNDISSADKKSLATYLNGGSIIDLRRTSDSGYEKDPTLSGVTNKHFPIEGEASAKGYRDTFIGSSSARSQFGSALNAIANASGPVLVHCKAGKDRTGWTVALVMMAAGASKSQALNEYLKSPNVDKEWFNAAYDEALKKSHSGDGTITGYITQSISDGGLGVSKATLTKLKEKFKQ